MVICSLRKKTARLACAAGIGALCAAVLLGCNGVMLPKKVNVIADPTFNVGIGSAEEKLDDYASAADIQDMIGGEADGMTVYDYNPGGNSTMQQFALYYEMEPIPIDVNEALDAAEPKGVTVEIPEQKIVIPTITIPKQSITVDNPSAGTDIPLPDDANLPIDFTYDGAQDPSPDVITPTEIRASGRIVIAIAGVEGDVSFKNMQLVIGTEQIKAQEDNGEWVFLLEDTPLTSDKYDFEGSITISKDAVITGDMQICVSGAITKIDSMLVGLPPSITKQTEYIPLNDLEGLVEKIEFSQIGASGTFTSELPAGNDITIKVSTGDVGLFDKDPVGVIEGQGENQLELFGAGTLETAKLENNGWQLPFTVTILPSPDAEEPDENTLYRFTDVKPGESYKLSGELTSVMEWESITLAEGAFEKIAADSGGNQLEGERDLPIKLSELKSNIDKMISDFATDDTKPITEQIHFSRTEVYPFIIKPQAGEFTNVAAKGTITLVGDGVEIGSLLEEDEKITLLDSLPSLPDPGRIIKTDFSKFAVGIDVSADLNETALTEVLNKNPAPQELKVKYDMSITGNVTIRKGEIDKLEGGKLSISAAMLIVIPLELKLPNDVAAVTISLSEALAGEDEPSDKDLLGREKPVGTDDKINENLDKLIRSLDTLSVAVSYKNRLGVNLDATLTNTPELVKVSDGWVPLPKDEKETYMLNKEFTIDAAEGKADIVDIVGADILDKVLYAWPFNPEVTITIKGEKENGETYIKIPREAMFKASVSLAAGVSINGVYDFSTDEFVL